MPLIICLITRYKTYSINKKIRKVYLVINIDCPITSNIINHNLRFGE